MQFGGQTPLKLAAGLAEAGVPLLGTSVEAIDLAEDRGRFGALLDAPRLQSAAVRDGALGRARRCDCAERGRLSRCSCAPPTCSAGARWRSSTRATGSPTTCAARRGDGGGEIFLDRFLEDATEVDVDALCDGARGVDRRDHAARRGGRRPLGRQRLRAAAALARRGDARADPRARRASIALAIGVVGLINVQYAVHARRAVRDRGQPARLAHGAVRLQGRRRAAGEARLPDHARRARSPSSSCRASAKGSASAITSRSRRRCCRSTASRAPTRCSARRCARPAR